MSIKFQRAVAIISIVFISILIGLNLTSCSEKKSGAGNSISDDSSISGTWDFEMSGPKVSSTKAKFRVKLRQIGSSVTGAYLPEVELSGDLKHQAKVVRGDVVEKQIHLVFLIVNFPLMDLTGNVSSSGDELSGSYKINKGKGFLEENDIRSWKAKRIASN